MRNIKSIIEYNGKNYSGWQSQDNALSVQEVVEKAISKVMNTQTSISAASRTDAGVHARGQVINYKINNPIHLWNLKQGINSALPRDINIINCEEVNDDFHARFDAKNKYYRYIVSRVHSPFNRSYSYIFTYKLNIEIIKTAAQYLLGEHDFLSFTQNIPSDIKTIRCIKKIEIIEKDEFIYFDFEAPSFLRNMIRIIVGTLLDFGRKEESPIKIKKILEARDRRFCGHTALSCGLFLMRIDY